MALSMERQLHQIRENEARMSTVLDNMITAILLIDHQQKISLLNRQAEILLDYEKMQWLGHSYHDIKHPVELPRLIGQSIRTKKAIREEMTIFYPQERMVEIHIVPLQSDSQEQRGLMVMIHDITTIRKLEMMRRDFVSNVSHEIKTPLTALKGFAETLLAGALDDRKTAVSFLEIIQNEADRLNRLIVDIMQLSRIESGSFALNFSAIDFQTFSQQLIKMMSEQAKQKQILLECEIENGICFEADEDRLQQILINLVSNAISYTPHGGHVLISAKYSEPYVEIIVADSGIGIPKQDQERIFERFYRVDKARARESGGTGLGLSIVKHLIELHHGQISVDSRPGLGSRFTIILPVIQS
jgi:two-component system phosphate regulon sensor histidine kinase PhoR